MNPIIFALGSPTVVSKIWFNRQFWHDKRTGFGGCLLMLFMKICKASQKNCHNTFAPNSASRSRKRQTFWIASCCHFYGPKNLNFFYSHAPVFALHPPTCRNSKKWVIALHSGPCWELTKLDGYAFTLSNWNHPIKKKIALEFQYKNLIFIPCHIERFCRDIFA